MWLSKRRIYLDHAAATPVLPEVLRIMKPYWNLHYGNPSSISKEGAIAREAVERARADVARTLRVRAENVTFTSGGTESNNLALFGAVKAITDAGVKESEVEIISTRVEHPSILRSLEHLEKTGCAVKYISVGEEGLISRQELEKLLSPKTRIVSVAYANSETGVVQDLGNIGRAIRAYEKKNNLKIIFHTDASQAPLWLPCALDALSIDMMTQDAGKCGGPKGIGVLVHRGQTKLSPILYGGSQEDNLRPGTENVPLIVGCAKAIETAQKGFEHRATKVARLRDEFIKELETIKGVVLNGSRTHRLANNVNISIPGIDTEYAVVVLDKGGVACSTKSACSGSDGGRSAVVYEMTKDEGRANSTIRFSLGEKTTRRHLSEAVRLLREHIKQIRTFAPSTLFTDIPNTDVGRPYL